MNTGPMPPNRLVKCFVKRLFNVSGVCRGVRNSCFLIDSQKQIVYLYRVGAGSARGSAIVVAMCLFWIIIIYNVITKKCNYYNFFYIL